ncbi:hypothetical protein A2856_00860 [Candidatus Uhrbacteria bacterium RIFCSPHIGHO2_01_FULL_63_20]|uniref:PEP-utilising enzyme mobile domain-containing protein n=1 Tax=Candidatus Uhrbacteria bacterium RIFCSPHIGHO2_01_FULL_63_20 TaxID=1802385 RepID=A0A1F7TM09_9BACT|nr:MAG: hypothetical protein A2856_00860 [Candidatus Uhrbacteria bacterium RIFCSPHIGHO2_01_FULL_63_20]
MRTFRKIFAVDNALITLEVWERHQTEGLKTKFGSGTPVSVFDVNAGVTDAYYQDATLQTIRDVLTEEQKNNPKFFFEAMDRYEAELDAIQKVIAEGKPLPDVQTLMAFAARFEQAWIGLDESYMPDYVAMDASAERRSTVAREKAFGFYVGADRLIRRTLEALFPSLGVHSKYLTLEEVMSGKLPDISKLDARALHFIYYKDQVLIGISFEDFCKTEGIRIESVFAPLRDHLRGQVASRGSAQGPVRIIETDTNRDRVKGGDVLVAREAGPRDLALIERASALVLDEGSYYGAAAIAARAAGKPCVFATRIATMVLQESENVIVDGDSGMIREAR